MFAVSAEYEAICDTIIFADVTLDDWECFANVFKSDNGFKPSSAMYPNLASIENYYANRDEEALEAEWEEEKEWLDWMDRCREEEGRLAGMEVRQSEMTEEDYFEVLARSTVTNREYRMMGV